MALELDVVVDGESNETLCAGAAVVVAAIKPTWTKDNLNFKVTFLLNYFLWIIFNSFSMFKCDLFMFSLACVL